MAFFDNESKRAKFGVLPSWIILALGITLAVKFSLFIFYFSVVTVDHDIKVRISEEQGEKT